MNRDDSGDGGAGTGPTGGAGTGPAGGSGTGPGRDNRKRQRPTPAGPERATKTALWLIPVLVILAAFLLACGMGQASGQSCGEKQISGGASPSYNFSCEVNR